MILKGSQRGGARRLAAHLLNTKDNEHVEIHEIRGFMADTLREALDEAHAISKGTRCKQFLFSVSLNPPETEDVPVSVFEDAIDRIENKTGLEGQPRVVAFHEKNGRYHAHAVWSRIDPEKMKAINLPYFKNRLHELSKSLFLEHGWKLPRGMIDRTQRNPLNFTREEWHQAKKWDERPEMTRRALQECWASSETKKAFERALERQGFYLARGNRRGFVAVDWRGEVYSLSRCTGVRKKALTARLGEPHALPSVDDVRAGIDRKLVRRMNALLREVREKHAKRRQPLLARKKRMVTRHRRERAALEHRQSDRQKQELETRQARFRSGLRGFWDRLTGRHRHVREANERDAYAAYVRDRDEKDALRFAQLDERRELQRALKHARIQKTKEITKLRKAIHSRMPESQLERFRLVGPQHRAPSFDLEL